MLSDTLQVITQIAILVFVVGSCNCSGKTFARLAGCRARPRPMRRHPADTFASMMARSATDPQPAGCFRRLSPECRKSTQWRNAR